VKEVYALGSRCEGQPGGRRGEVKFVGPIKGSSGTWIGVALDEPQGKNDGSKNGVTYFECRGEGYGCFLRPENVAVGDFPELDPFACLSDDDEI
jgi:tubulin-folding cofactor B